MDCGAVCAVIVTYNIGSGISNGVDSLIDQVGAIVIVDNGSGGETRAALRELGRDSRVRLISNSGNLGIAAGLNQGVRCALSEGYRWVLTLDHDSEATPGMVQKLLQAYEALGEGVGIVAANPFERNSQAFQWRTPEGASAYLVTRRPVSSSGSLISQTAFAKAGLFNESLFLYYVDDDFCARVRRAGLRIAIHSGATLIHREGHRVKRRFLWRSVAYDRYSESARYYIARNGIYMTARYPREMCYGYVHLKRMVIDLVKIALYDDQPLAKLGYTLKGWWDGLRGKYGALKRPLFL